MANTPAPGGNLSVFTMPPANQLPKPAGARNTSGAGPKPYTGPLLGAGSKPPKLPKG